MGTQPVIKIDMLGGNCPVQAEGTVNGAPFYFRARGQRWTFSVGQDPVAICCGEAEGFHYEEAYGDEKYAAGWMTENQAEILIGKAAALYVSIDQKTNGMVRNGEGNDASFD